MAFCQHCGKEIEDGVKFCTSCGNSAQVAPTQSAQPIQPVQQQQIPVPQPVGVYQEGPISTAAYVGIMFLISIPVLNLILLIVWACGGCQKRNLQNMARATLIWMLIWIVLGGLFFLTFGFLFGSQMNQRNGELQKFSSEINAYSKQ